MMLCRVAFTFVCACFFLWLELSCSSFGIYLPFSLLAIFYITVLCNWRSGLFSALIISSICNSLVGEAYLISSLLSFAGAYFWRRKGDCSQYANQWIPALFFILPATSISLLSQGVPLFEMFGYSLTTLLLVPLFPLIIFILDKFCVKLGLVPYSSIQREEFYEQR